MRLIGLVSTVILARLLTPEDFGVAAMGMLVIGFLTQFSSHGAEMHLIRTKDIDRAHCDTAWSFNVMQGLVVAVLLVALAVPASAYFQEPRVIPVMYVLALAATLASLESIGPSLARRNLEFALDFRFNVYKKLLVFVTTISCALLLRNYWALVIGYLTGTIAGLTLSYLMFPQRPRWCLTRSPEYLRFALSVLPMRIGFSLYSQVPRLVAGGLGAANKMGAFTVSSEIAHMLTYEIVSPMGRGLFPNYSRLAQDPERLATVYRSVVGIVAMLCIPLGIGLSSVADDVVALLLGVQWDFAGPLIEYLAPGAALSAIAHIMTQQILVATGHERDAAILVWVRVGVSVPLIVIGASAEGVLGIAKATVVAPLVYLPFIYLTVHRAVGLPLRAFVGLLWRPLVSAAAMFAAVHALHADHLEIVTLRLLWDVSVGAAVFTVSLLGLWLAAGRPAGAEQTMLRLVWSRLRVLCPGMAGPAKLR